MSQYGFRADVLTKTILHKFVQSIEASLAKKKQKLGILNISGAFDNITVDGITLALE